jgi:toxin ParE1/3/4
MNVVITRRAAHDISQNFNWLAERSASQADRWRNRLLLAISTLETDPVRCPLADETVLYDGELRELLSGKRPHVFRILFEIRGKTVFILRVRHARQDQLNPDDL